MPSLSVKEAVAKAKDFVTEVLADEQPTNIGLEEVEFESDSGIWLVTIGFSRPWNSSRGPLSSIAGEPIAKRAYRVIEIADDTGLAFAMKRPERLEADA